MVARQYQQMPELAARYGPSGRLKCHEDALFHLSYLSESIAAGLPALFADYIAWAKIMLAERNIPAEDLAANLRHMRDAIAQALPQEMSEMAARYIGEGLELLPQLPASAPSLLTEGNPLAELARGYLDSLLRGERHVASRLILDAVAEGTAVKDIYLYVFQRAQYEIGRLWQINRLSVAQEHYCTAATQLIMSQLYPHIFATEKNGRRLVATCIGGDLHEIGIRMVSDFFEMEGWDTFYLGANTPIQSIVQTVADRKADVLALSATITYNVRIMTDVIEACRARADTSHVIVMVGGYPFNVAPELLERVRADAYAPDAQAAIEIANQLLDHRMKG
jgi:methanogenic corrinoid protein MtbC1